jgi:hypothetical protein
MPKYIVTMTFHESIIIEAENEEQAEHIAHFEADSDDWDDPIPNDELLIEEYDGDQPAFNQE